MSASPRLVASRMRTEAGWLFAASFRPFFLGACLHAAAAVPLWAWMFVSGVGEVAHLSPLTWHAHEMVFGFLPAVIAGYLLSATPNWSGKLPASGYRLAALFALWLAGRVLPLVLPFWPGTIVDAIFPLTLFLVLAREARVKSAQQSRHGLMLFPLLALASIAHRLSAGDAEAAAILARTGISVGALLIAAVGGRLVPSFTRNALSGARAERVPEPYGRFDIAVLFVASAGLVSFVVAPAHPVTAATMMGAGVLHVVRLLRWRGWLLREMGLAALHLGYGWLAAGTLLAGLAARPFLLVPPDSALHALTAGAIGTMTLAVMGRLSATRGQGRRAAPQPIRLALIAANLAALARVAAPLVAEFYVPLLGISAVLWLLAFAFLPLAHLRPPLGVK
ncbi:NnrS family protein [Aurantimonas sp. VKM B-3413]|uniref:NnrS family protein n=1 Tax=Aurantimonas sp. VKM B-3413 TaxID=2779401 RepID=UPI001E442829|nr:NnrS family protein [Aurantimonas sp. VKM B-3413]MCB8836772.1 NnrS family protein [Aurantimonas sp. VKM B-3413]